MDFENLLKSQLQLHPHAQPRDAVKLCFQAAFGAEHLLQDIESARQYFDDEFSAVGESDSALFEQISPDFCRVNLAAWKRIGLPYEWLFNMFCMTACGGAAPDRSERFITYLQTVETLAIHDATPFTLADWQSFMAEYNGLAPKPVHHSARYRENEHPAYRVVSMQYVQLIPQLKRLAEWPQHVNAKAVVLDEFAALDEVLLSKILDDICGAAKPHG